MQHSAPAKPAHGAKLAGVEALRGIAAALVVFSHAARHVDRAVPAPDLVRLFQPGHAGVDLFFTLSGFIILLVHRRDIGDPSRVRRYAARRFDRVMPLYWAALTITVGFSLMGGHSAPPPDMLLWWAALLPTANEPLFGIAWTLQYEAMFYACFAVLIASRTAGIVLLTAWLLCILVGLSGAAPSLPVCSAFGLEFLFGLGAAQALHVARITRPRLLACVGAALFAAAYGLEATGLLGGFGVAARLAYGIPAALLIVGIAASERSGPLAVPRWLAALGSASYSTYLFQFVFIALLWQALRMAGAVERLPAAALFGLLAASALAGGLAVARWVERPLLEALRRDGWTGLARRLFGRARIVVPSS